jgi:hypothetical protein
MKQHIQIHPAEEIPNIYCFGLKALVLSQNVIPKAKTRLFANKFLTHWLTEELSVKNTTNTMKDWLHSDATIHV